MTSSESDSEFLVLQGLLSNVVGAEEEAALKRALKHSVTVDLGDALPMGSQEIATACGVSLDVLVQHQIVVDKQRGVSFLRLMGDLTSPNQLKKLTLKQRRYEAKFSRPLTRHGFQNVYTYAELLVLVNRPLLIERMNNAASQLLN